MAIFEIYGGNAPNSVAAYGNGITLGILGAQLLCLLDLTLLHAPASAYPIMISMVDNQVTLHVGHVLSAGKYDAAATQTDPARIQSESSFTCMHSGQINSLQEVLKEVVFVQCSLHHCQCLWRTPEPSCHFCNLPHGAHLLEQRGALHGCPGLGWHLWVAHGGMPERPLPVIHARMHYSA